MGLSREAEISGSEWVKTFRSLDTIQFPHFSLFCSDPLDGHFRLVREFLAQCLDFQGHCTEDGR